MESRFDDIRSYRDYEAAPVCKSLLSQAELSSLMLNLLPGLSSSELMQVGQSVESILDFQKKLMLPVFQKKILPTFDKLTVSGLENLSQGKASLFISNHRDIVLDSTILNYFLLTKGLPTAEIAIGDNLLTTPWVKDLVRLNKSFIVKRGLDNAGMLMASKELSAYIKDTICIRKESVWIAQRAGRAKDGKDETNRGLLSMLALSSDIDIRNHINELNIIPVSISYEYDPCDARKAKEILQEIEDGNYIKSENEDMESMILGLTGRKGNGHIHFGKPVGNVLTELDENLKKSELLTTLKDAIDSQIQGNYKLWPSNFIADDHFTGEMSDLYSAEEKELFFKRIEDSTSENNEIGNKLSETILSMYRQPLLNVRKRMAHS